MATNVYQIVTDRIISEMEKGIIPWRRPWFGVSTGARSYITGQPYSLINQFLIGDEGEYITFKQAQKLGGSVKKGAKSKLVVYYQPLVKEIETVEGEKKFINIPFLRYYNVFNIADSEGNANVATESKADAETADNAKPTAEAKESAETQSTAEGNKCSGGDDVRKQADALQSNESAPPEQSKREKPRGREIAVLSDFRGKGDKVYRQCGENRNMGIYGGKSGVSQETPRGSPQKQAYTI